MRAREFINESKRGKPEEDFSKANPGTLGPKNRDNLYTSRYYDHYRMSTLMGLSSEDLENTDAMGYLDNLPVFVAYTDHERDKITRSMKKLGIEPHDYIQRGSKEVDHTNKTSPVAPYKKNKHGI